VNPPRIPVDDVDARDLLQRGDARPARRSAISVEQPGVTARLQVAVEFGADETLVTADAQRIADGVR
jgi:hypothetical protein